MIELVSEDGTETRHFEIPATSIAVGGTFALAYLEALDVDTDTLKLIDSQYMHSPCMQLAVQNGEIIDHAYAVYGADWSVDTTAWSAKCDELNVDLTFTDEYGTGKCGNQEAVNVLFHGNADDTAILRAEWVKFVSLFFDKEQFANEYFALESDAVEAIKTYVEKGIVASLSEKKTCVWVQKMGSYYEILHDTFRTSLCVDAGMLAYQGEAGVLKRRLPSTRNWKSFIQPFAITTWSWTRATFTTFPRYRALITRITWRSINSLAKRSKRKKVTAVCSYGWTLREATA